MSIWCSQSFQVEGVWDIIHYKQPQLDVYITIYEKYQLIKTKIHKNPKNNN